MKRLDLKASGFMAPDGVLVFLDVFGLVSGTKISEDGVGDGCSHFHGFGGGGI